MASSSSNQDVTMEVREEYPYPYPSNLSAANFISVKLSGRDKYGVWKTQMLCLLESHGMLGFVDGKHLNPQTSRSISGKEKKGDHLNQTCHRLWRRSDALAKGWILGSLSEETLTCVLNLISEKLQVKIADFSAKDVWDELEAMYGLDVLQVLVEDKQQQQEISEFHQGLYEAVLSEDLNRINEILREGEVEVTHKITNKGNTALHVAVATAKKPEFIENLLELAPKNTQLLNVQNSDGSTLLHVAVIVENTEAAGILMQANGDLLLAKDKDGRTPLMIALSNLHINLFRHLLEHIDNYIEKDTEFSGETLFSGTSGDELLVGAIFFKDFGLARDLVMHYNALRSDVVLMAIAQYFPRERNILSMHDRLKDVFQAAIDRCVLLCGSLDIMIIIFFAGIYWIIMIIPFIFEKLACPFVLKRAQTHDHAVELLHMVCKLIKDSNDPRLHHVYYTNPILEAVRQNANEVLEHIVFFFPNAIRTIGEDGHDIIQYAVINRSEKLYNLLYQMGEHKDIYKTMKDHFGNNLLHLAARLAPTTRLSGAALQLQRELQWFQEVEKFVWPPTIIQKNSFNETPQMVFTREHKDLVVEGEKWMKATAESYTITAALITTIVFAAAITVPGGNDQVTGIPVFTNRIAFKIFAISDAVSLFASITTLFVFLSILTTRFATQDFLFKLPTKLMIGLTTLFISTMAMLVAFGATLYLVFGQNNAIIVIPIALLTCLPITSFVTLQFPLVVDLMSATYGRSIFGKKGQTFDL